MHGLGGYDMSYNSYISQVYVIEKKQLNFNVMPSCSHQKIGELQFIIGGGNKIHFSEAFYKLSFYLHLKYTFSYLICHQYPQKYSKFFHYRF